MTTLIFYELLKTYRKLRTYIGFALILVMIPLVYWGLSYAGPNMVEGMTRRFERDFILVGNLFNGWLVAYFVMNTLWVHIPFLIVLAAGDTFAGEATGGTFRILLTRPPSRTKIFGVKMIGTTIYTISLVIFLAALSIGLGIIFFGTGDMLLVQDGFAIIPQNDVWWRFLMAYLLAAYGMSVVASVAILFSTFVENAIGPIVGAMAVHIIFFILGSLPFEFFESIRPYLYTTYINIWQEAFADPINWTKVSEYVLYLAIFYALFSGSAWLIFKRKDILS